MVRAGEEHKRTIMEAKRTKHDCGVSLPEDIVFDELTRLLAKTLCRSCLRRRAEIPRRRSAPRRRVLRIPPSGGGAGDRHGQQRRQGVQDHGEHTAATAAAHAAGPHLR